MKKKISIIGAGITGLVAGCYGQINNFDTEIFEMHNLPGGFCTGWKRNGYWFDGCIHWLMGTTPNHPLYEAWEKVGALAGKKFIYHESLVQLELGENKKLTIFSDINKFEALLLELSPEDEHEIREFANEIRIRSNWEKLINPDPTNKYNILSKKEFIDKFKSPFLREAFTAIIHGESLFFFMMQLGTYNSKDASWPIGGSLEFAKGIATKYVELGGKINYQTKIKKIIVEDNTAVGIMSEDGSITKSDYIISAADGYSTVFKLLDGKFINDDIKSLYKESMVIPSSIQISLGVNCDLSNEPSSLKIKLTSPIKIGNKNLDFLNFRHYCYDPTVSEPGKSVVTSLITSDYDYWEKFKATPNLYEEEKKNIANQIIDVFEKRFPLAQGKIEVVDVATPYTFYRYTDSWKGCFMGWGHTKQAIPKSLPNLKGLYLAGQWTSQTSGLPTSLVTGIGSIKRICEKEGVTFY